MNRLAPTVGRYAFCAAAVCAVIFICYRLVPVNSTSVSLFLLLVVLGIATTQGLAEAIFTSIIAVLGFNFFFLPPVATLTFADPENWVALFVFLVTAYPGQAPRRRSCGEAERDQLALRTEPLHADG
jgi:two-component system sensor histidine kinase KdpD